MNQALTTEERILSCWQEEGISRGQQGPAVSWANPGRQLHRLQERMPIEWDVQTYNSDKITV